MSWSTLLQWKGKMEDKILWYKSVSNIPTPDIWLILAPWAKLASGIGLCSLFRYLRFLDSFQASSSSTSILCPVRKNAEVDRDETSYYYLTQTEYPDIYYPPFCYSYFAMMTSATSNSLIRGFVTREKQFKFYYIYMGILARRSNITMVDGKKKVHLLMQLT